MPQQLRTGSHSTHFPRGQFRPGRRSERYCSLTRNEQTAQNGAIAAPAEFQVVSSKSKPDGQKPEIICSVTRLLEDHLACVAPVALKHALLTANPVLVSFGAFSPTEGTLGLRNSVSRHQVAGFKCRMATLKRTQQRHVAGRQRRAFLVKHRPDSDRCAHSRPGWVPRSPRGSAWVFHGARLMERHVDALPPLLDRFENEDSSHFYILSSARDESFYWPLEYSTMRLRERAIAPVFAVFS